MAKNGLALLHRQSRLYVCLLAVQVMLLFVIVMPHYRSLFGHRQPVPGAATARPVAAPTRPGVISGKPAQVIIARLGIDLPVLDGVYDAANGSWTLSAANAHFALTSALPNSQSGDTFLYGHNNRMVFGRLHELVRGDTVRVVTQNGYTFRYRYIGFRVVAPEDTSIFAYKGPPALTIQTCSGVWNERRQLFAFKLEGIDSAAQGDPQNMQKLVGLLTMAIAPVRPAQALLPH